MSLPADFWQKLPNRADSELYDIIVQQDDYQPEALDAVRAEIRRRGLPPEQLTDAEARATTLHSSPPPIHRVTVTDINMPFGSMIVFMVKWAFASIPAFIIVAIVVFLIMTLLGGIFGGVAGHSR
jgi:hypothetical protein